MNLTKRERDLLRWAICYAHKYDEATPDVGSWNPSVDALRKNLPWIDPEQFKEVEKECFSKSDSSFVDIRAVKENQSKT